MRSTQFLAASAEAQKSVPAVAFNQTGDAMAAWLLPSCQIVIWALLSKWKLPGRTAVLLPVQVSDDLRNPRGKLKADFEPKAFAY